MSTTYKNSGFTIVELIVVIAIILILTTIAIVNLQGTQATARDVEREQDVQSIASRFEDYYNERNFNQPFTPTATYPHTSESSATIGLSPEAYRAPGTPDGTTSLVIATNTIETNSGITPQPSIDQYVYQPFNEAGALCTSVNGPCVRFNIFWRSEVKNSVQKITSRHQQ